MAEPARVSAADREPTEPERNPGAAERGWLGLQQAAVTALAAWTLAMQELARHPDAAAVSMAGLTSACAEKLGDVARAGLDAERGRVLDEAALAAERRQGYDEGWAACQAARCRLQAVDGG